MLTRGLADRCEQLLAVDVSDDALDQARQRCIGMDHVRFERRVVPEELPAGPFDLVVLSEVGYYLAPADFGALLDRLADAVEPGGHLVLVHWTGETDYPQTADDVHGAAREHEAWTGHWCHRTDDYRLDVLERTS